MPSTRRMEGEGFLQPYEYMPRQTSPRMDDSAHNSRVSAEENA